jgi:DNA-directed RNA polymerase specialized sigma24 family protein
MGADERRRHDRRVEQALADIQAGHVSGLEDLYDLLLPSVYALCQLVTPDQTAAEHATVEAFTQIWSGANARPADTAGTTWVLNVACRCARHTREMETAVTPAQRVQRGHPQHAV